MSKSKREKMISLLALIERELEHWDNRMDLYRSRIVDIKKEQNFHHFYTLIMELRNTLNSHYIDIHTIVRKSVKIYEDTNIVRSLKDIDKLFDNNRLKVNNVCNKMAHNRNLSSHPNPYQLNLEILSKGDMFKDILETIHEDISEAISAEVFIKKKEKKKQYDNLKSKVLSVDIDSIGHGSKDLFVNEPKVLSK